MIMHACTEVEPEKPLVEYTSGALVLNNGNWGSNDSNISFFDIENNMVTENVFEKVNGTALGDLGQDILIYGSKAYVAVCNSGVIFAIDKNSFKITGKIVEKSGGSPLSPRHLLAKDGYVYVTYYEGYVGQIDTSSLQVKNLSKVGSNPEGIASSGNELYVANSGGMNYPVYDKTVSVIDISSMKVTGTIEVGTNPCDMVSDLKGDIYVLCIGNYGDDTGSIIKIDHSSHSIQKISGTEHPSVLTILDNTIYLLQVKYDSSWNAVKDLIMIDVNTGSCTGSFFPGGDTPQDAGTLSADPLSGLLFVGRSDYVHTGNMNVYETSSGVLKTSFSTGGLNPWKVAFLTDKK